MFNLEQAITKWKRQMAAAGIKPVDVDELESHLRDEIDRLVRSGADEQHAYKAATARLGEITALKAEFRKLHSDEGWQKFLRIFYFISVAYVLVVSMWTLLEYEMSLWERFAGISAAWLITLCLARLPYWLKSLSDAPYQRLLRTIKLAISLVWLWAISALLQATHVMTLDVGILPTTILWCVIAAIALAALAWGLNDRSRPTDPGTPPPPFQPQMQPIPPTRPCPLEFGVALPPGQKFTPRAWQVLAGASEEASRLGHDFIGTEHVLLGVLKLAKGALADVLKRIHLDRETVRLEIEKMVSPGPARAERISTPFTPRACKALQLAAREAKALAHPSIHAEHILLGLLLEGSGVAGRVLKKLGVHASQTRSEIATALNVHQ
jgi:hypothetical protein